MSATNMPATDFPSSARVVIIGGGVHGASLLWHLTQEGWTDVMLIEKAELTSGSTWHAAGQITRSVGDYTTAAFHHYALELYHELPGMTGQEVSLHTPGGIRVAYTDDELDALKTHLGVGRYIGYPIELLGPMTAITE
jgi:dimethylglycine dehydrogenase